MPFMTEITKSAVSESSTAELSAAAESSIGPKAAPVALPAKTLKSKLLGGSLTLLAGSGLVGVTNPSTTSPPLAFLAYRIRPRHCRLHPADVGLGHYSLIPCGVCKVCGEEHHPRRPRSCFRDAPPAFWIAGIGIGLILFLLERPLTAYLNLPDPVLISLLALGTAFYVPLGVRRGYIQGIHAFRPLAINFMLEGLVRLFGVFVLIGIGTGVRGAVLASVVAVVVSYFAALPSPGLTSFRIRGIAISFREGLQAIVFFSGQTVINNFDIVLVKHFFLPPKRDFMPPSLWLAAR